MLGDFCSDCEEGSYERCVYVELMVTAKGLLVLHRFERRHSTSSGLIFSVHRNDNKKVRYLFPPRMIRKEIWRNNVYEMM